MRVLVVALAISMLGCAAYHRVEEEVQHTQEEYHCPGFEISKGYALCLSNIQVGVTIVW